MFNIPFMSTFVSYSKFLKLVLSEIFYYRNKSTKFVICILILAFKWINWECLKEKILKNSHLNFSFDSHALSNDNAHFSVHWSDFLSCL